MQFGKLLAASAAVAALGSSFGIAGKAVMDLGAVSANLDHSMEAILARRISYGGPHHGGHAGQFSKKVDRQRRRNQMRRLTHQQQRAAA